MSDPRITDEATEAAAHSLRQFDAEGQWEPGELGLLAAYRDAARGALEAGVPLLAPQSVVDREALSLRLQAARGHRWDHETTVDAVMELARPMPTQKQIARAQYDQDVADGNQTPNPWGIAGDIIQGAYLHSADAVLALINGTPE